MIGHPGYMVLKEKHDVIIWKRSAVMRSEHLFVVIGIEDSINSGVVH